MRRVVEVREHRPGALEMVERKGLGHPDTICDALAEELSIALSRCYLERFGEVLHHNVDKVLLRGGVSRAAFGGGEVLEPTELYLAGRATQRVGDVVIPTGEIVVETARTWLRTHLRHVDPDRHVRIHDLVRPGSVELVGLFDRQRSGGVPLSNDTSIGVGFAPATALEELVLAVEQGLNSAPTHRVHPAFGEDVKVMGVRSGVDHELTVACALVDRHLCAADDYDAAVAAVREVAAGIAAARGVCCTVHVNTGDDPARGQRYLTVTGTSAESGDDGEVGRGNRVGGLITPHRPMTMEAAAGKNAITHVGKLYNVLAGLIAGSIVEVVGGVASAQVHLVSQIGRPIDDPHAVHVALELTHGLGLDEVRGAVDAVVDASLPRARELWRGFLDRAFAVY